MLAFFFHLFSGFQTVKLFSRGQYGTYTNAPFVMSEYTNGCFETYLGNKK